MSLFCVEAVIKVVLTLVVYSLTMWDVYCQVRWCKCSNMFYVKGKKNVSQSDTLHFVHQSVGTGTGGDT